MKELNPIQSLSFFNENIPEFLLNDGELKNLIVNLQNSLKDEKATDFHAKVLMTGRDFIKHIFMKSVEYLSDETHSPKNRSIKKMNEYIDAFTVFEEMLFGLDPTYRDHTLHSLWVYLFGHQFIMSLGGYDSIKIAGQMDITYSKDNQPKFVLTAPHIKGARRHLEAMWGMISILHDLGYPVEAISTKPHEVFGRILDPFAIDFSSVFQIDLGSRIALLHQSVCDLLSTMYRPQNITSEELTNLVKQADEKGFLVVQREAITAKAEAIEMEFRIATVDKIHSAWSAMLSFKNIAYLHESDYHGGGSRDYLKLLTKRDILYSIVHHTSEEPKDEAVNRFQFILLLMDDIEEAIRYSRGGKERGLVSDHCDVEWEVSSTKTTIKLAYTKYNDKAESRYKEMENKYKAQVSREGGTSAYTIEIRIIGKRFGSDLKLHLVKDM